MAKNENQNGKKSGMRWEIIVALLTVVTIVFIVFSGVWYLSTFDSMRNFTNGVYSKTDDWQGVNEQYNDMVAAFNAGSTAFTYHIAGIDIPVSKVDGATKDQYIDKVLDGYTAGLYERTDLTGVKGAIHAVAGESTHLIYTIVSIVAGIILIAVLIFAFTKASLIDFLKQTGASFLIAGIISLVGMFLVYALLVNTWINTNTAIYKEGLPIIAQMIQEWFTLYILAFIVLGIILVVPAALQLLTKGKQQDSGKKAAPK